MPMFPEMYEKQSLFRWHDAFGESMKYLNHFNIICALPRHCIE